MGRFDEVVRSVVESSLPRDFAGQEDLHVFISLAFSTLNGLALDTLRLDSSDIETKLDLLVRWAKQIRR